jgi:bacterioferritin-associated ferredoxin
MKTVIIFTMIVYLCEGLNERALLARIRSGATTVRALAHATGAGTRCGSCSCDLKRLVRRERTDGEALPLAAK